MDRSRTVTEGNMRSVNATDRLITAARIGNVNGMRIALREGAYPDPVGGEAALSYAFDFLDLHMVAILLAYGASVHSYDIISAYRFLEAVRLILRVGVRPSHESVVAQTLTSVALTEGHDEHVAEMFSLLVAHGWNPHHINFSRLTPLQELERGLPNRYYRTQLIRGIIEAYDAGIELPSYRSQSTPELQTLLHSAVALNDETAVIEALSDGADPTSDDVVLACRSGNLPLLAALLAYDAPVSSANLAEAVREGHVDSVRLLLRIGVRQDMRSDDALTNTILSLGSHAEAYEMYQLLVSYNYSPTVQNRRGETVYGAMETMRRRLSLENDPYRLNRLDVLSPLITDADSVRLRVPIVRNALGEGALSYAFNSLDLRMVAILLAYGASVDSNDIISANRFPEAVRLILRVSVPPSHESVVAQTLSSIALTEGHDEHAAEIFSLLVAHGWNPHHINFSGLTPLQELERGLPNRYYRRQLISGIIEAYDAGIELTLFRPQSTPELQTLLHSAVAENDETAVIEALRNGANPTSDDVVLACRSGNLPILAALLAYDAPVSSANLAEAVREGHVDSVRLLLRIGVRQDMRRDDALTNTILSPGSHAEAYEMYQLLISYNYSPTVQNRRGETVYGAMETMRRRLSPENDLYRLHRLDVLSPLITDADSVRLRVPTVQYSETQMDRVPTVQNSETQMDDVSDSPPLETTETMSIRLHEAAARRNRGQATPEDLALLQTQQEMAHQFSIMEDRPSVQRSNARLVEQLRRARRVRRPAPPDAFDVAQQRGFEAGDEYVMCQGTNARLRHATLLESIIGQCGQGVQECNFCPICRAPLDLNTVFIN
jgi:ankyrin repeat protein